MPQVLPEGTNISTEQSATNTEAFEFEIEHGQATLRRHVIRQGKDVISPELYAGVPVTRIAASAFEGDRSVKKVTIPGTVTDIGTRAFASCTQFKTVSMDNGAEEIHSRCFEGRINVQDVFLPESVCQRYKSAFAGCTSLREISVPESVEVLNRFTFRGCSSLTSVRLPYALRRIAAECFADCTSLRDLYYFSQRGVSDVMVSDPSLREECLPAFLEYIGPRALTNCSSRSTIAPVFGA